MNIISDAKLKKPKIILVKEKEVEEKEPPSEEEYDFILKQTPS